MKPLDRQKLDAVHKTQRHPPLRDWRGQFTPAFASQGVSVRLNA